MDNNVRVLVLRTAGTNCDMETAFAFRYFGARTDLVHVNRLLKGELSLTDYHILALPGGFTYGDDIAAGRILANELRIKLGAALQAFLDEGKLIIGICNGFQVLVKTGLLPGFHRLDTATLSQEATLTTNDSGKFEDRWTYLSLSGKCVWTKNCPSVMYIPVAHAEGKFVCKDELTLKKLQDAGQVVFRYCRADGSLPDYPDNPNGSLDDIAGITDPTGRILGLMPHPERHFFREHHASWTRGDASEELGEGARIFQNGIAYVEEHLL